jgi:hypothetical protein
MVYNITEKRDPAIHHEVSSMAISREEIVNYPFNPNNAIEIIGVGLSIENTLLTLLRLQSLAYGFETFAWRQKAKLSRLLMVFKEQPDTDKCIFLGLKAAPKTPLEGPL